VRNDIFFGHAELDLVSSFIKA